MTNDTDIFAVLTPEELELSNMLSKIIQQEIELNGGVIPFSRYMELALYYPQLGYYSNRLFKFGARGDFVTAPLISNLFGYTLSLQINELFGFGVCRQILEFGAGNGKLAADILSSLGDIIETYYILELSADLIAWQKEMLSNKVPQYYNKVIWLTELPLSFDGTVIGNEVLDAQPCELVRYIDGIPCGVGVAYQEGKFIYQDMPLSQQSKIIIDELRLDYHDYLTEIHPANIAFMNSLAKMLNVGAVILIDYGVGEREYYHSQKSRGSLRGFFRQQVLDSVLVYPGLIDITSSVNWTSVATSAINNGLELIGYTNQASFLINLGLTDTLQNIRSELNEDKYLQISNQVNKLTSHNEMGDAFKVCGFSKGLPQDSWLGFADYDKSYML